MWRVFLPWAFIIIIAIIIAITWQKHKKKIGILKDEVHLDESKIGNDIGVWYKSILFMNWALLPPTLFFTFLLNPYVSEAPYFLQLATHLVGYFILSIIPTVLGIPLSFKFVKFYEECENRMHLKYLSSFFVSSLWFVTIGLNMYLSTAYPNNLHLILVIAPIALTLIALSLLILPLLYDWYVVIRKIKK